MTRFGSKARLAAAAAMAMALQACDDRGGPVDAPQPPSLADMAAMSELPYAEPARIDYRDPSQGYAWAERAYGLQRAVYDTPPDYGFEYDGVEPLAWETQDDWAMYAEPWDEGYRYYYYEPGVEYPYFVRDAHHGYAYDAGGILVAVFDAGGRYLTRDDARRFAPVAGRYWVRGHELRGASGRRIRVSDDAWAQRAPQFVRTADPWMRAAREDGRWRQWRTQDGDRELQRFAREAERRESEARRWRERDRVRQVAGLSAYEGWSARQQRDERARGDAARDHQRRQGDLASQRQRPTLEVQRPGPQGRQPAARREDPRRPEPMARQQSLAQRGPMGPQREDPRTAQVRRQQAERQPRVAQDRAQREQVRRQGEAQRMAQDGRSRPDHREPLAQQQAQREQMRRQGEQQRMQQAQARQQQEQARRQQMAQQQQQAQREPQGQARHQARAAEQQGQPAAARERGPGPGSGPGRGHGRKD